MGSPENLDMKQVILLIALALATPTLSVPVDGSERVLDVAGCLALQAGKTLGADLLPFGGFGAGLAADLLCKEILKPKEPELPKIPGLPEIPKIPGLPELPKLPGLPEIPKIPELPEIPKYLASLIFQKPLTLERAKTKEKMTRVKIMERGKTRERAKEKEKAPSVS